MSKARKNKLRVPQPHQRATAVNFYNDGVNFNQQGNLSKAETAFRKALSLDPGFVEAHNNLGNVLKEQGKWKVAEKSYRQALSLLPDNALILSNLGNALYNQNKPSEALPFLERAISIDPGYALAQHNLGSVLMKMRRRDEAIKCFKKAYQLMPEMEEIGSALSSAMCEQGECEEAISIFNESAKANPNSVVAYMALAYVFSKMGDTENAIAKIERAAVIDPENARLLAQYAEVLFEHDALEAKRKIEKALMHEQKNARFIHLKSVILGKLNLLEEAEALALEAIALDPHNPLYLDELGNIRKEKGDYQKAKTAYLQAMKLSPDRVESYYFLSTLDVFGRDARAADIASMERLLEKGEPSENEKVLLNFALGVIYDGQGQYKKAFDYFSVANKKKAIQKRFSLQDHQETIRRIKELSVAGGRKAQSVMGQQEESDGLSPVFISGLPRTGKTVVEGLLKLHPDVSADGETNDLLVVVNAILAAHGRKPFPEGSVALDEQILSGVRSQYVDRLKQRLRDLGTLTNTLPANFYLVGLIRQHLPEAKIILCVRDSKDAAVDIFKKHFRVGYEFSYDPEVLAEYMEMHKNLADFWLDIYPGSIHLVHFERLIQDPERELKALLEFCDLQTDSINMSSVKRLLPDPEHVVGVWRQYESFLSPMFEYLEGVGEIGK